MNVPAARNAKAAPKGGLALDMGLLVLRLAAFRGWTVAPLGHELVELGLVLCKAQPVKELAELSLFFLQPLQGVGAILIESAIAA
jgi:hypothetical protein